MARSQSARRRQARLFAVAAHASTAPSGWPRPARQPAPASFAVDRQSDRRDLDRPAAAAAAAPSCCTICATPAKSAQQKLARVRARDREGFRRRARGQPIRTRSPGCSTSAAATFRTRRSCSPSRWCRARAGRRSMSTAASSATTSVIASKSLPTCARAPSSNSGLAALGSERRKVRLDPAASPGGDRPPARRERRQDSARRRSDRADEGGEERGRDRRRARGAAARRRGGDAVSRLVRPRGAGRPPHRDRRGRGAGKLSPRHRAPQGRFASRPSPAPAPTAPSCITASPAAATAGSRRANSF